MYQYETEKQRLSGIECQKAIVATAFKAHAACRVAGAVTMGALITGMQGVSDSWQMMAVVDHLREFGYLYEVQQAGDVAGQYRVFRWIGPSL